MFEAKKMYVTNWICNGQCMKKWESPTSLPAPAGGSECGQLVIYQHFLFQFHCFYLAEALSLCKLYKLQPGGKKTMALWGQEMRFFCWVCTSTVWSTALIKGRSLLVMSWSSRWDEEATQDCVRMTVTPQQEYHHHRVLWTGKLTVLKSFSHL